MLETIEVTAKQSVNCGGDRVRHGEKKGKPNLRSQRRTVPKGKTVRRIERRCQEHAKLNPRGGKSPLTQVGKRSCEGGLPIPGRKSHRMQNIYLREEERG